MSVWNPDAMRWTQARMLFSGVRSQHKGSNGMRRLVQSHEVNLNDDSIVISIEFYTGRASPTPRTVIPKSMDSISWSRDLYLMLSSAIFVPFRSQNWNYLHLEINSLVNLVFPDPEPPQIPIIKGAFIIYPNGLGNSSFVEVEMIFLFISEM